MDEDTIIKERVVTSEVIYKRLLRICQTLTSIPEASHEDIASARQSVVVEIANYESMLTRLQLQLNMNVEEINHYEKEKVQNAQQIERLQEKTVQLEQEYEVAQKSRREKEVYNKIIDFMMKPKTVVLEQPENESGKSDGGVSIIAQLNNSRQEEVQAIESLREEIQELEAQKEVLLAQWNRRKEGFQEMIESIENFRREVVEIERTSEREEEDEEEQDRDHEDGDHEENGDDKENSEGGDEMDVDQPEQMPGQAIEQALDHAPDQVAEHAPDQVREQVPEQAPESADPNVNEDVEMASA
jgi:hypothetical protein